MKRLFFSLAVLFICSISYSQNERLSQEASFESSFKSIPLSKWTPGMRFIFQAANARGFYPTKKSKRKLEELDGKIAIFKNVKAGITSLCQFEIEGESWTSNTLHEPVDGVVYIEYIQAIRDSLVGKQVYVIADRWTQKGSVGSRNTSNKYFKVTIDSVTISEFSFVPYRISFTSEGGIKGYSDIQIGGFNVLPSDEFKFSTIFSYTDPRLKYPNITNDVWKLIQAGEVIPGMTKLECRLSFGDPKKVNKTITENEVSEQWVYEGNYLYFTGDKLKAIQTN